MLLILLLFLTPHINAVRVLSAIKSLKDIELFGDSYILGTFEVQFDQALVARKSFTPCQKCTVQPKPPGSCEPCYYNNPDVCDNRSRENTSCPCLFLDQQGFAHYQCTMMQINGTYSPINISRREIPGDIGFYAMSLPSAEQCTPVLFRVRSVDSFGANFAASTLFLNSTFWQSDLLGDSLYSFCPEDQDRMLGTLTLQSNLQSPHAPIANTRITSTFLPSTADQPDPEECQLPSGLTNETHECLTPGVRKTFPPNYGPAFLHRFVIPLPNTPCFYLSHGGDHLAAWMSFTDPWLNGTNYKNDSILWNSRPIFVETHPEHRQMSTFVRYVCPDRNQRYLYASVLIEGTGPRNELTEGARIWWGVTEDNLQEIPFSDMTPGAYSYNFLSGLTLRCGNKTFSNLEGNPLYFPVDSGIINLRVLYPQEQLNYFYPVPLSRVGDERLTSIVPEVGEMQPGKFAVGVLLSWDRSTIPTLRPTDAILPKRIDFLTEAEFDTCTLEFHGTFAGEDDGFPVIGIVDEFEDKNMTCDPEVFTNLTKQVKAKLAQVSATVAVSDIFNLALSISEIKNSDMYVACFTALEARFGLVYADQTFFTDLCVHPYGTPEYLADQCCNPELSGYAECVNADRTTSAYNFDSANLTGVSSPDCAYHYMQKLYLEYVRVNEPGGCREPIEEIGIFRGKEMNKYLQCRRKFIRGRIDRYSDGGFARCRHDTDCTDGICTMKGFCSADISTTIDNILQCVIDTSDGYIVYLMAQKLNTTDVSPELFRTAFEKPGCNDIARRQFPASKQMFTRCDAGSGCPDSQLDLLSQEGTESSSFKYHDVYDIYPFGQDCLQSCGGTVRFQNDENLLGCSKIICNWYECNPATQTDQECTATCSNASLTAQFCGVCEDEVQCVDYTNLMPNQVACESATFCLHADGTQTFEASEASCTQSFSCDSCTQGTCDTQASCEAEENGYCTDSTDENNGLWIRAPFNETLGGCLVKVTYPRPWDQTVDVDCVFPAVRTSLGACLDPSVTESECTLDTYPHRSSFATVTFAQWITPAVTKADCDAYGMVCFNSPNYELGAVIGKMNIQHRVNAVPEQCSGRIGLMFRWVTGRWLPGQPRTPVWQDRRSLNRLESGTPTFDFSDFSNLLSESITEFYGLKIQDQLYCTHSETSSLANQLTCLFDASSDDNDCLVENSDVTAITSVCAGSASTSQVPPFIFNFSETSIPGNLTCERVQFQDVPRLRFRTTKPESIAILLITYSEDTNYTLRNENRAVYGRVLSNGITVRSQRRIFNVTMTVKKGDDNVSTDKEFPILDLAVTTADGITLPLSFNVTEDEDNFYFDVAYLENGTTYYIVSRIDGDYATHPRRFFSSGETAYISVILALYAIGTLITAVKLFLFCFALSSDTTTIRLFIILITIFSFFLFRTVLFSLVLEGTLLDTQSPAVGYVLIEFPIILFFSFVTQYIVLWFFLVKVSHKTSDMISNWITSANFVVGLTNLFILLVFIVIIILFETIVEKPALICNNEIAVYDEQTAFTILITYRAVFSTISILLGFLLFASGTSLLVNFASDLAKGKIVRIGTATIAGTFGLIAQGIYYLVITATRSAISNYVTLSILLVVEIIPAFCFLMLAEVSTKMIKEVLSDFKTSTVTVSSGGKGGSKSGGGSITSVKN